MNKLLAVALLSAQSLCLSAQHTTYNVELVAKRIQVKSEMNRNVRYRFEMYDSLNYQKVDSVSLWDLKDSSPYALSEKILSTKNFSRLQKKLSHPDQVLDYVKKKISYVYDYELYGDDEFYASAKYTFKNKAGDCEDGAFFFSALLLDDGLKPCFAVLENEDVGGLHMIAIYKTPQGYGSGGINRGDFTRRMSSLQSVINRISLSSHNKYSLKGLYEPTNKKYVRSSDDLNMFKPFFEKQTELGFQLTKLDFLIHQ